MKVVSKKLTEAAASVLNNHIAGGNSRIKELITGADSNVILELFNEVLDTAAEGSSLVAAVESSGALLGFVPRSSVPIPEPPPRLVTPTGPDTETT